MEYAGGHALRRYLSQEAIARCSLALVMGPNNWGASFCRALASEWPEGVGLLKALLSCQESDSQWMKGPSRRGNLADIYFELARRYLWLDNYMNLLVQPSPHSSNKLRDALTEHLTPNRGTSMLSSRRRSLHYPSSWQLSITRNALQIWS